MHELWRGGKSIDVCLVFIILAIGYVYTGDVSQFIDIGLYDESSYLRSGLKLREKLPNAEWAPLYAYWYGLLSLITADPVELYFLNYGAMTVAPAVGLLLALRTMAVPRVISVVLALWLLGTSANFPVWPKVSHFALTVVLLGIACTSLVHDKVGKVVVLTLTSLLASYVRPEYFLSAIAFFLLFVWVAWSERHKRKLALTMMMAVGLAACWATALTNLGMPVGSGSRSLVAFGQHYAVNWVSWNADHRDPWTNWKTIVRGDFGAAASVGEALRANTMAFMRHVLTNLQNTPREVGSTFMSTVSPTRGGEVLVATGLLSLAVAIGSYGFRTRERLYPIDKWPMTAIRRHGFELLTLVVLGIPSLISILLIYPRHHYLLVAGVLIICMGVAILTSDSGECDLLATEATLLVISIALLLVRATPAPVGVSTQPILKTIEFLRTLNIASKVYLLEADGGYDIYLGRNYERVAEYEKDKSWKLFLAERKINMIILADRLRKDVRFVDDAEWIDFIEQPSKYDFEARKLSNIPDIQLIYRKDMFAN